MKDNFDMNLKRVIPQLTEYTPDKDLWNKISGDLDFDERIDLKIKDLPTINHSNDLWPVIESELNRISQISRSRTRQIIFWSLSIAATLFLLVILLTRHSGSSEVNYSLEYVLNESFIRSDNFETENPVDFVRKCCILSAFKCTDPAFENDLDRLVKLDEEIKHLQDIITAYGESPALIKSLIVMENQKADLVKGLLKMLRT